MINLIIDKLINPYYRMQKLIPSNQKRMAKYYFDVLGKEFISQISFFFISFLFFCHDTKEPKSLGLIEISHRCKTW